MTALPADDSGAVRCSSEADVFADMRVMSASEDVVNRSTVRSGFRTDPLASHVLGAAVLSVNR